MFILVSCKSSLPGRFDTFVTSVEKKADTYSEKDWDKANNKFEKLYDEYTKNRRSYSPAEKRQINEAIGRYAGIVVASGYDDIVEALRDFTGQLPGLIDGAKSLLEDLGVDGLDDLDNYLDEDYDW